MSQKMKTNNFFTSSSSTSRILIHFILLFNLIKSKTIRTTNQQNSAGGSADSNGYETNSQTPPAIYPLYQGRITGDMETRQHCVHMKDWISKRNREASVYNTYDRNKVYNFTCQINYYHIIKILEAAEEGSFGKALYNQRKNSIDNDDSFGDHNKVFEFSILLQCQTFQHPDNPSVIFPQWNMTIDPGTREPCSCREWLELQSPKSKTLWERIQALTWEDWFVIGCLMFLLAVALMIFWCIRRKRMRRLYKSEGAMGDGYEKVNGGMFAWDDHERHPLCDGEINNNKVTYPRKSKLSFPSVIPSTFMKNNTNNNTSASFSSSTTTTSSSSPCNPVSFGAIISSFSKATPNNESSNNSIIKSYSSSVRPKNQPTAKAPPDSIMKHSLKLEFYSQRREHDLYIQTERSYSNYTNHRKPTNYRTFQQEGEVDFFILSEQELVQNYRYHVGLEKMPDEVKMDPLKYEWSLLERCGRELVGSDERARVLRGNSESNMCAGRDRYTDIMVNFYGVELNSSMRLCQGPGYLANELTGKSVVNIAKDYKQWKNAQGYDKKNLASKYINASWVSSFLKNNAYICTQGPKYSTTSHFWKMIMDNSVNIIVMLTNLEEKGPNPGEKVKTKCDKYWPPLSDHLLNSINSTDHRNSKRLAHPATQPATTTTASTTGPVRSRFDNMLVELVKEDRYTNYYRREFLVYDLNEVDTPKSNETASLSNQQDLHHHNHHHHHHHQKQTTSSTANDNNNKLNNNKNNNDKSESSKSKFTTKSSNLKESTTIPKPGQSTTKVRRVVQYHFIEWQDKSGSQSVISLLDFHKKLKLEKASMDAQQGGGPMVIHCSAGAGRTGSFALLDSCLEQLHCYGKVNIVNMLAHLRYHRTNFVQTREQYSFIYRCLATVIRARNFADYVTTSSSVTGAVVTSKTPSPQPTTTSGSSTTTTTTTKNAAAIEASSNSYNNTAAKNNTLQVQNEQNQNNHNQNPNQQQRSSPVGNNNNNITKPMAKTKWSKQLHSQLSKQYEEARACASSMINNPSGEYEVCSIRGLLSQDDFYFSAWDGSNRRAFFSKIWEFVWYKNITFVIVLGNSKNNTPVWPESEGTTLKQMIKVKQHGRKIDKSSNLEEQKRSSMSDAVPPGPAGGGSGSGSGNSKSQSTQQQMTLSSSSTSSSSNSSSNNDLLPSTSEIMKQFRRAHELAVFDVRDDSSDYQFQVGYWEIDNEKLQTDELFLRQLFEVFFEFYMAKVQLLDEFNELNEIPYCTSTQQQQSRKHKTTTHSQQHSFSNPISSSSVHSSSSFHHAASTTNYNYNSSCSFFSSSQHCNNCLKLSPFNNCKCNTTNSNHLQMAAAAAAAAATNGTIQSSNGQIQPLSTISPTIPSPTPHSSSSSSELTDADSGSSTSIIEHKRKGGTVSVDPTNNNSYNNISATTTTQGTQPPLRTGSRIYKSEIYRAPILFIDQTHPNLPVTTTAKGQKTKKSMDHHQSQWSIRITALLAIAQYLSDRNNFVRLARLYQGDRYKIAEMAIYTVLSRFAEQHRNIEFFHYRTVRWICRYVEMHFCQNK